MRLGVLDVGSNTVHLLIVDARHGGAPVPAHSRKIELRLAESLTASGEIGPAAVRRLVDFVQESTLIGEDAGVAQLTGFATSAIREAPNGCDVIEEVERETGVRLVLLSGDDEARLTFLAVRRWFGWSSGRLLVFDIGGGSLEIAAGADEEPDEAFSLELGAGRLTRNFIAADPPTAEEVRELRRHIRSEVASVAGRIGRLGRAEMAVATSKTFRQLARITGAAPSSEGPYVRRGLERDDLGDWIPRISAMTAAERAELPGVSAGRSAQLVAGALVAEAVMDIFGQAELVLCPWALREGVILRHMDALDE
ncbi:MAG: exopolyphosphatase / guanosine-5-triphosphate,3-diphosphate pyrophosphatase [Actinomycetota bacterium]|nr:exopolyphosphatase / guanosine-5-triphosphate,3-diphosphate pyrophosphatase [Actinomycetota bacterium]